MVQIDIKNELVKKHLENILEIDLYKNRSVETCPHCNCNNFIKHGSYQNKQRFLCKSCKKTFSKRTNTTFYRTKKSLILWNQFINLMLSKKSLRECSIILNISLSTSFFWRHKILSSLKSLNEPNDLTGLINITKIFTKENYKGSRNAPSSIRKKVWTILAHDTNESILASPISIDRWDEQNFNSLIYSKISKEAHINSFCDSYLHRIASKHNITLKVSRNSIHSTKLWKYILEIRNNLRKFNGVATKYLKSYLYFSSIFTAINKLNSISLLYSLSNINFYITYNDFKFIKAIPS